MSPPREHRRSRTVRFGECDPFGFVYTPVFFDWVHEAMESWFEDGLGLPYATFLVEHGLPAVHSEADFARPCRFGDAVVVAISLAEQGRSSLVLAWRVEGPDGVRATGRSARAVVSRATGKAVPLPADLRARIARWSASPESP